ncbi:hypothetical protein BDR26DRAFT_864196 [Obelidium mucronatum]|nr:hypothetical protein BDR26DRAFT_864196 [Obelidium mucronatum]
MNLSSGDITSHPTKILISATATNSSAPDLYAADLLSGKQSLILQNDGTCTAFLPDHEFASCIATRRISSSGATEMLHIQLGDIYEEDRPLPRRITRKSTIITTTTFPTHKETSTKQIVTEQIVEGVVTVSEGNPWYRQDVISGIQDRSAVYMSCYRDSEHSVLVSVDLKTKERSVLASHKEADVVGCLFDPVSRTPWMYQTNKVKKSYGLIGGKGEQYAAIIKDMAVLEYAFGFDGQWSVESMNHDGTVWVLRVKCSDSYPERFYLYDRKRLMPMLLFTSRLGLRDYSLAKTNSVEIYNRDGQRMLANLTLPKEMEAPESSSDYSVYPLPLIVLLESHASEMERTEFGFNPYHQFFASRGFAVISPHIRGTVGLGQTWKMQSSVENQCSDIIDCVNWAVFKGIALQEKVALYVKGIGHQELCREVFLKVYPISHVLNHPILNVSYAQELLTQDLGDSVQESTIKASAVKYLQGSRRDTIFSL